LTDNQALGLVGPLWELNGMGNVAAENLYSSFGTTLSDLDQDWTMFLDADEGFGDLTEKSLVDLIWQ
jgi:hypothetical protein